jgi:hypothetical protein
MAHSFTTVSVLGRGQSRPRRTKPSELQREEVRMSGKRRDKEKKQGERKDREKEKISKSTRDRTYLVTMLKQSPSLPVLRITRTASSGRGWNLGRRGLRHRSETDRKRA